MGLKISRFPTPKPPPRCSRGPAGLHGEQAVACPPFSLAPANAALVTLSISGQSEISRWQGAPRRSPENQSNGRKERAAHPASAPPAAALVPRPCPLGGQAGLRSEVMRTRCFQGARSMLHTRCRARTRPQSVLPHDTVLGVSCLLSPSSFSTLRLNSQTQEGTHLPPSQLTGIPAPSICPLCGPNQQRSRPRAVGRGHPSRGVRKETLCPDVPECPKPVPGLSPHPGPPLLLRICLTGKHV